MKKPASFLILSVIVLILGGLAYLMLPPTHKRVPVPAETNAVARTIHETAATPVRQHSSRQAQETESDEDDSRSPADRKLANEIDRALTEENLEAVRGLAAAAMASTDVEIHQAMVDALAWFDEKTLVELTPFMADRDEDVADFARTAWKNALSSVENQAERIHYIELAMRGLSNEETLEEISNEYIGMDERPAVESLLTVIEQGRTPEGIAKAKETYEFVTGEEFESRAAAEQWLAEQENAH